MRKNISTLLKAIKENDLQLVKSLLADGVSLLETSGRSNSPLHAACDTANVAIINLLKVHGAKPNVTNAKGETPLHKVVKSRNLKAFISLLSMNPDIDAKDYYGNAPIHLAVLEGQTEMVELLVQKGVKLNSLNEGHETALEMAQKYNESKSIDLLEKAGGKKTMSLFGAIIKACQTANIFRKVTLFTILFLYCVVAMSGFFVQGISLLPMLSGATSLLVGLLLVLMDKPFRRIRSLEAKLFNGEMTCAEYEAILYRNELLALDNDLLSELEFGTPINDNVVYSRADSIDLENNQIH